jgi:hypothetical protein
MSHLDALVARARAAEPAFDPSRSLSAALVKKECRARRDRIAKKSVFALAAGTFLAVVLLRVSIAPAAASGQTTAVEQPLAAHLLEGDSGFARD